MTSSTGPWHTSYEVLSSSSIVESQSMNEYYNYLDSLSNDCECMGANACKYYLVDTSEICMNLLHLYCTVLEYNEKIYIGVIIGMIHKYGVIIVNVIIYYNSSLSYLSAVILAHSHVNTDSMETKTNH